jgi:hypothetical protein
MGHSGRSVPIPLKPKDGLNGPQREVCSDPTQAAFGGVLCMAVLLPCGILMRRNSAAHRRVLILATICISDAGFSRFVGLFVHEPTTFLGTYLYYEGGNLLIIVLMFLWDWKRDRMMKQFLWGASLVTGVGLAATGLYFNATWQSISRSWLEAWAQKML